MEGVTDTIVWDNFASVFLSNEHRIPDEEHLQAVSKMAWSFNKVGYFGESETSQTMKQTWKFIEKTFGGEIETLKMERYP